MEIIDSHSHIGKDYFWRESNLSEYIDLLKSQNVTTALVMPVPGQTLYTDSQKRYLVWYKDIDGKMKYYSERKSKELENPYEEVNEILFNTISCQQSSANLKFIPLINPIFDSKEYLDYIIFKYKPLAIKIHGVACGIGPNEISKEMINHLKKINLPIITHTDYCQNPTNTLEEIRKLNSPYEWAKFFINNDIYGYLTHGARMDKKTFELVNKNDNLVIGIGPDLKISEERFRWVDQFNEKNYLQALKENLEISKILFDLDYSWNTNNNDEIDYLAIERINNIFNENDQKLILGKNAKNFFNIKERE